MGLSKGWKRNLVSSLVSNLLFLSGGWNLGVKARDAAWWCPTLGGICESNEVEDVGGTAGLCRYPLFLNNPFCSFLGRNVQSDSVIRRDARGIFGMVPGTCFP